MPIDTESSSSSGGFVARKAADFAAEHDWSGYYKFVLGKPPRPTLVKALDLFDEDAARDTARVVPWGSRLAVDLGCGEGRDTLELLRRGWRVLATDPHPEAFEHLRPRVVGEARLRLQMLARPFGGMDIPPAQLVNASYSLPFCEAERFWDVWAAIVRAIEPGGRFAGQFFGDRDDWARSGRTVHMTRRQVEEALQPFEVEHFEEEEKDDVMATGGSKHWHVFHVVARKR
jgi:tellurite methyltransferase